MLHAADHTVEHKTIQDTVLQAPIHICGQGLVKVCPNGDVDALVCIIEYGNVTNATKTRSVKAKSSTFCSLKDLRKSRKCVDPKRQYVCTSLTRMGDRWRPQQQYCQVQYPSSSSWRTSSYADEREDLLIEGRSLCL